MIAFRQLLIGFGIAIALPAIAPATATAVTMKDIVSMTKAGVSEQVILAVIERDKNVFTLGPDELAMLHNEGVSDAIVIAMVRSGREEPPAPAPPPPPPETSYLDDGPIVGPVVGHGPDRPNASTSEAPPPAAAGPYLVPYFVPVPYPARAVHTRAGGQAQVEAHCQTAPVVASRSPFQPPLVSPFAVNPQPVARPCAALHLAK